MPFSTRAFSARPAVEVPAGDFFGASFGDPAACSLLLGTKEGWSYANFPMPFDRSARIELVSERGSGGPDVTITSEVVWQDRPREGRTTPDEMGRTSWCVPSPEAGLVRRVF
jgi:hypothetical protein